MKVRQHETGDGATPEGGVSAAGDVSATARENDADGFASKGVSVSVRQHGTDGFSREGVPVVGKEAQETGYNDDDEDDDDDKYSEFADEDRQESMGSAADEEREVDTQEAREEEVGACGEVGDSGTDDGGKTCEEEERGKGRAEKDGEEEEEEEAHSEFGGAAEKGGSRKSGHDELGEKQETEEDSKGLPGSEANNDAEKGSSHTPKEAGNGGGQEEDEEVYSSSDFEDGAEKRSDKPSEEREGLEREGLGEQRGDSKPPEEGEEFEKKQEVEGGGEGEPCGELGEGTGLDHSKRTVYKDNVEGEQGDGGGEGQEASKETKELEADVGGSVEKEEDGMENENANQEVDEDGRGVGHDELEDGAGIANTKTPEQGKRGGGEEDEEEEDEAYSDFGDSAGHGSDIKPEVEEEGEEGDNVAKGKDEEKDTEEGGEVARVELGHTAKKTNSRERPEEEIRDGNVKEELSTEFGGSTDTVQSIISEDAKTGGRNRNPEVEEEKGSAKASEEQEELGQPHEADEGGEALRGELGAGEENSIRGIPETEGREDGGEAELEPYSEVGDLAQRSSVTGLKDAVGEGMAEAKEKKQKDLKVEPLVELGDGEGDGANKMAEEKERVEGEEEPHREFGDSTGKGESTKPDEVEGEKETRETDEGEGKSRSELEDVRTRGDRKRPEAEEGEGEEEEAPYAVAAGSKTQDRSQTVAEVEREKEQGRPENEGASEKPYGELGDVAENTSTARPEEKKEEEACGDIGDDTDKGSSKTPGTQEPEETQESPEVQEENEEPCVALGDGMEITSKDTPEDEGGDPGTEGAVMGEEAFRREIGASVEKDRSQTIPEDEGRGAPEEASTDVGDGEVNDNTTKSGDMEEAKDGQDTNEGAGEEPRSELELEAERSSSKIPEEEEQGVKDGTYTEAGDGAENERNNISDEVVEEEGETQPGDDRERNSQSELEDTVDKGIRKGPEEEGWGAREETYIEDSDDAEKDRSKLPEEVVKENEIPGADEGAEEPPIRLEDASEGGSGNIPEPEGRGGDEQEEVYSDFEEGAEKGIVDKPEVVEEAMGTQQAKEDPKEIDDAADKASTGCSEEVEGEAFTQMAKKGQEGPPSNVEGGTEKFKGDTPEDDGRERGEKGRYSEVGDIADKGNSAESEAQEEGDKEKAGEGDEEREDKQHNRDVGDAAEKAGSSRREEQGQYEEEEKKDTEEGEEVPHGDLEGVVENGNSNVSKEAADEEETQGSLVLGEAQPQPELDGAAEKASSKRPEEEGRGTVEEEDEELGRELGSSADNISINEVDEVGEEKQEMQDADQEKKNPPGKAGGGEEEGDVEIPVEGGHGEEKDELYSEFGDISERSDKNQGYLAGEVEEMQKGTQELNRGPYSELGGGAEEEIIYRLEEDKKDTDGSTEGELGDKRKEEEDNEEELYNQFEYAETDEDEGKGGPSGEVRGWEGTMIR